MRKLPMLLLLLACSNGGSDQPTGGAGGAGSGGRGGQGGSAGRGGSGGTAGGSGGTAGTSATGGGGAAGSGGGTGGSSGGIGGATGGTGGSGGTPGDGGQDAAGNPDTQPDAAADARPAGNPFVYVGGTGSNEIRIFQLDMASGALMSRGSAPAGASPDYMAFHPSGKYLYALNEVNPGRVVAFSVNATTGALTRLNDVSSGGDGPAHISIHKSGKWILSSNYGSGHVAALPIMDDGRLGPPVMPIVAGDQAHMILDDGASGNFVFVPSKGNNRTLQYRFDATTGRLMPNTPAFVTQAGSPRHMVFHRNGQWAFLLTEAGLSVISYRYDSTTGLLSDGMPRAAAPSGDGAHIMIHPTKDILYASIRFYNAIAIFNIGPDGRAGQPRHVQTQIARPWDFAIDPTGQYMLVANNDNGTVQVFRIADDGGLTRIGQATAGGALRFVGILPPQ